MVRCKNGRVQEIVAEAQRILQAKAMAALEAASLAGKVHFLRASVCHSEGSPALNVILQRARQGQVVLVTKDLELVLGWLVQQLLRLKPRVIWVKARAHPVQIFTDGVWSIEGPRLQLELCWWMEIWWKIWA